MLHFTILRKEACVTRWSLLDVCKNVKICPVFIPDTKRTCRNLRYMFFVCGVQHVCASITHIMQQCSGIATVCNLWNVACCGMKEKE